MFCLFWININSADGVINTYEQENLKKNFILYPGDLYEYNVVVTCGDLSGAIQKSIYASITMNAETLSNDESGWFN